jgi:S1-C subfamily serine protease
LLEAAVMMMRSVLRRHTWVVDLMAYVFCVATLGQAAASTFTGRCRPHAAAAALVDEDDGIRKVGERSYEIRRATFEKNANLATLSRSARIVPQLRDGRATGFRLYSVQADGLIARLGLQNEDLVTAVNGVALTSPEQAERASRKAAAARHVSVDVERNGQRLTYEYRIR